MSSMQGLATVIALIITIFGAPPLFSRTISLVQGFVASHYGYGLEEIVIVVWGVLCAGLVFFVSRASVSTSIMMLAIVIATRFL